MSKSRTRDSAFARSWLQLYRNEQIATLTKYNDVQNTRKILKAAGTYIHYDGGGRSNYSTIRSTVYVVVEVDVVIVVVVV